MQRIYLLFVFAVFVVCSFCGKDFVSLGRHSWRCKRKILNDSGPNQAHVNTPLLEASFERTDIVVNSSTVKCCCGKICKGIRGLKMHQRRCRITVGLHGDTFEYLEEEIADNGLNGSEDQSISDLNHLQSLQLSGFKPGIRLPKSEQQWSMANEFFKASLPMKDLSESTMPTVGPAIEHFYDIIYNYFKETCGVLDRDLNKDLDEKYSKHSSKELKKLLKSLKANESPLQEVKFVSHLLRSKLGKSNNNPIIENHDEYIAKNFWGFVKNVVSKEARLSPTFTKLQCINYFTKVLSSVLPNKRFAIPSWIPCLNQPSQPFNLDPPTYQKVTQVINRMKASASPCPLDKISVICFKRCPFLRSYLTEIIRRVWSCGEIPLEWKRACTVLAHKKGTTDDPANFRPITLQSVPLKIFTSCLRDSIFEFLQKIATLNNRFKRASRTNFQGHWSIQPNWAI